MALKILILIVHFTDFIYSDKWDILQLSKESTTSAAARNCIAKDYGIQWSAFIELPGWMPHGLAPFDPMHCLYLGKLVIKVL
jgi:hypothetical protein